jgi:translation initiation factor 1 (eIF-1/SUI1)
MDKFDNTFYKPETELDEKYANEIHMHRINRGTRKSDVIIQGLSFKTNDETKEFVSLISKKFGISGCYKILPDYDDKNKVFIFSGDKRNDIREILIKNYNKDDEFIKYHG